MVDLGTGNNNKINWAMNDKQVFIDIVETVYRGARKGRGLVVSPKGKKKILSNRSHHIFDDVITSYLSSLVSHAFSYFLCRLLYKIPLLN